MKNIFLLLVLSCLISNIHSQTLSIQTGTSTDFYFRSSNSNSYNPMVESHSNFLGLHVSYTRSIDTIKDRNILFFLDLYQLNIGNSIKNYPDIKNGFEGISKYSSRGVLSPSIGAQLIIPFFQKERFSGHLLTGGSFRFSTSSYSAQGHTYWDSESYVTSYYVQNKLNNTAPLSIAVNLGSQLKYEINKGVNFIITPLASIGLFKWYEQFYNYEFRELGQVIESGTNKMNNNGTRFQLLFGFEFQL